MGPPDNIRQHRTLPKQKAIHSKGLLHQLWFMESGVFNPGCPLGSPGGLLPNTDARLHPSESRFNFSGWQPWDEY